MKGLLYVGLGLLALWGGLGGAPPPWGRRVAVAGRRERGGGVLMGHSW